MEKMISGKTTRWLVVKLLFLGLALLFLGLQQTVFVKAEAEPEVIEEPVYTPPQFKQPYFSEGGWRLPGHVLEARTLELFGRPVDLALVQYADYKLWAALGVDSTSGYEAFIDGISTRPEMLSQLSLHLLNPERFSFTLYLPGPVASPQGAEWALCEPALSEFCRLANLQENSGPVHADLPRQGQSNLFIQKGYFPEQYRQAVLVWRIAIVEED